MRQDQLDKARLARWRQDGNALLTLDDAERWLAETPLCLYLPRRQHLPVPAPSFVEAIAGRADATPGPEHVAAAAQMLARLVASGAVIALNLFGAAPGIGVTSFVGEHPDFLATPEALPYLYALQPERNPKRPPTTVGGARVSPLAAEAYTLLEREGALTTIELRSRLGREVTEAAVLRSLAELWHTMRVVPVPADNPQEGAHWELLSARHRRELNIGSTQSQTTALSILVSFYLQSAIAATAEEVEIFLSPLASRSRIRDVVHGLSTTRQLASFSLAGDEQFYVEGTLPEVRGGGDPQSPARCDCRGRRRPGAERAGSDRGCGGQSARVLASEAPRSATFSSPRLRRACPRQLRRARSQTRHPQVADRHRQIGPRAAKAASVVRNEAATRGPARDDSRGSYRRPEGAEGTDRPPRPNFERRARPGFANASESRERPARSGGPSRPRTFDRPNRFARPIARALIARNVAARHEAVSRKAVRHVPQAATSAVTSRLATARLALPTARGASVPERPQDRRDSRKTAPAVPRAMRSVRAASPAAKDEAPPGRTALSASRRGILVQIAVQIVPPADPAALKVVRPAQQAVRLPQRAVQGPEQAVVQVRQGVQVVSAAPRAAMVSHGRPSAVVNHAHRETAPSSGPYASAGDRPPGRGPGGPYAKVRQRRSLRAQLHPPPPARGRYRSEGGERESRPFRPAGQRPGRPGGFSKSAGRPGSFGKPGYGKSSGYRKPSGDRSPAGGDRPTASGGRPPASGDRPERPRPLAPHSVQARANLAASGSQALPPAQRRIAPPKRQVPESRGVPGASAMRAQADRVARPQRAASNQAASSPVESVPVGNHPEASARRGANRVVRGTKARCPLHDRRSS